VAPFDSTKFFLTLPHKRHDVRKKGIEHKMCSDFLYCLYLKHFSFWGEYNEISSKMSKCLYLKYPLFFSDFDETWIFSIDFRKSSDIRFDQNPPSGNRVVPCGQTDMKLIIAFRNFANAPKTSYLHIRDVLHVTWASCSLFVRISRHIWISKQT
jgi:hypothetical protein